jgi:hypothetical protein
MGFFSFLAVEPSSIFWKFFPVGDVLRGIALFQTFFEETLGTYIKP